jgi:hypothetical protein
MGHTDFEGYTGINLDSITFSNDIMLVIVLMLLTVFAWIFSLNLPLFGKMISNINAGEQRQSIFETTQKITFLFDSFMTFQTIFLCSIFMFSAAVKYKLILHNDIKTTLLSTGLLFAFFFIYYMFKRALSAVFGMIFVEKSTNKMLSTNYQALFSTWGILLYLPVLWILLIKEYFFVSVIILIISFLLFKALLLFRYIYKFFKKNTGFLFLSLYLCTHEIAPLVFLYQGVVFICNIIERNNTWQ